MKNFNPLYRQVRQTLIARIADGAWSPGEKLPSEFALADELGVSQGTVRKALNALSRDNIVTRQQGRGTFVPEQTAARAVSQFLRLRLSDGSPAVPVLVSQDVSKNAITAGQHEIFGEDGPKELWNIERMLKVGADIGILERIFVHVDLIPDIDRSDPLPVELYEHYQKRHGITISRVEDTLGAIVARHFHARRIGVPNGTPLLEQNRVSYDLRDRVIDMRLLHFSTDELSYAVSLK